MAKTRIFMFVFVVSLFILCVGEGGKTILIVM